MNLSKNAIVVGVVALVFIAAGLVVGVAVSGRADSNSMPLIAGVLAMIGTTIPAIIALARVESVNQKMSNGFLETKVKHGALQALEEHQVITRNGPVASAQLQALAKLLEQNTEVTKQNTAAQTENGGGESSHGRSNV